MRIGEKRLAIDFFDIGAIKFGSFKWKYHDENSDAPLAPTYTNLRLIRSHPRIIKKAVERLKFFMWREGLKPDLIADIPLASTPIVSILMAETGIPMVTPRKDEKRHGVYTKIEGVFRPGQTVLLIDDVISLADSKFEVIDIFRASGLIVKDILVLVDNELGGAEELKKAGINPWALYKVSELLEFYSEIGRISQQECRAALASFDEIRNYFRAKAR